MDPAIPTNPAKPKSSPAFSGLSPPKIQPPLVVTDWRRFSGGLWRVPEGDISAAYCADILPKLKVFTHGGQLFSNCGARYSGLVRVQVSGYPLVPWADYAGPEETRYSCEGREGFYKGERFRLGPVLKFSSSEPSVSEWQQILRVVYADGGYFACQASYRHFLADFSNPKTEHEKEAVRLEGASERSHWSKEKMLQSLDEKTSERRNTDQLSLGF